MAEAGFMTMLMTSAMNNPDVFVLGAAGGYFISWFQNRNKRKNNMFGP